jgi:hypothetical protein
LVSFSSSGESRQKVTINQHQIRLHARCERPDPVLLSTEICFGLRLAYPAGDGSAAILRSLLEGRKLVRERRVSFLESARKKFDFRTHAIDAMLLYTQRRFITPNRSAA